MKIKCYRKDGRIIYYASPDGEYHWVLEHEWPTFIELSVAHAPTTLRGTFAQCQGLIDNYKGEKE